MVSKLSDLELTVEFLVEALLLHNPIRIKELVTDVNIVGCQVMEIDKWQLNGVCALCRCDAKRGIVKRKINKSWRSTGPNIAVVLTWTWKTMWLVPRNGFFSTFSVPACQFTCLGYEWRSKVNLHEWNTHSIQGAMHVRTLEDLQKGQVRIPRYLAVLLVYYVR